MDSPEALPEDTRQGKSALPGVSADTVFDEQSVLTILKGTNQRYESGKVHCALSLRIAVLDLPGGVHPVSPSFLIPFELHGI